MSTNMLMNGLNPVGMVYNQSAENIAYDSNNSVKDMFDVEYGEQKSVSSSHATIKYWIHKMGNLIEIEFDIMPTGTIGADNIDTAHLDLPKNPKHSISAIPTFTLSASDRKPMANITLASTGDLTINGAMVQGRQGYCNMVYM